MVERNLENKLVAHRKIHLTDLAAVESRRAKSHIIDFGAIKKAIVEDAIDESHRQKSAPAEIALAERAAFKFLEIRIVNAVNSVGVSLVKEVLAFSHGFRCAKKRNYFPFFWKYIFRKP